MPCASHAHVCAYSDSAHQDRYNGWSLHEPAHKGCCEQKPHRHRDVCAAPCHGSMGNGSANDRSSAAFGIGRPGAPESDTAFGIPLGPCVGLLNKLTEEPRAATRQGLLLRPVM